MHRYWAAAFPHEYDTFGFDEDWIQTYQNEIRFTMQKFDDFLGRLINFCDLNRDYQVWIATSMGQAATVALPLETQLYIVDLQKFMAKLGVTNEYWKTMPAMLPQHNVYVEAHLRHSFEEALRSLEIDGKNVSWRSASSGFYSLDMGHSNAYVRDIPPSLLGRKYTLTDLGLANVKIDDRSGVTAYHIPQGVFLIYDPSDLSLKHTRSTVSALEIAPTILRNFSLKAPRYMKQPIPL